MEDNQEDPFIMKKARLVLLLSVWFVIPVAVETELAYPAAGQIEHAATPEQCRADSDAWGIPKPALFSTEQRFDEFAAATARDRSLTASTLDARMKEFSQCMRTDKVNSIRYAEAHRAYVIAQLVRVASFMKRHNLTSQFVAEDERGER